MKKKIIASLLAMTMILSFAACSGNNSGQEEVSTPDVRVETDSSADLPEPDHGNDVSEASDDDVDDRTEGESAAGESAVNPSNTSAGAEQPAAAGSNILIVYFSRHGSSIGDTDVDAISSASLSPGNTIVVADMIKEATGGDTFQIITVDPYPKDYRETTNVARVELDNNERPALMTAKVENLEAYDTIILGYPNWWSTIPMPVATFIEENNLSGKTILPYCVHDGSGLARSVNDITAFCPDSTVLSGLAISGGRAGSSNDAVIEWLSGHGII